MSPLTNTAKNTTITSTSTMIHSVEAQKELGDWMCEEKGEPSIDRSLYAFDYHESKMETDMENSYGYYCNFDEKRERGNEEKFDHSFISHSSNHHSTTLQQEMKESGRERLVSPDKLILEDFQHHSIRTKPLPIVHGDIARSNGTRMKLQMSTVCHIPIASPQPSSHSSSRAISLPASHIPRTQSEQQLRDDIAAAEWRDLCMFHRLVGGIRERQVNRWRRRSIQETSPEGVECERMIERSIANIVRHHQEDLSENNEEEYFIGEPSLFEYNSHNYPESKIPYYDENVPLQTDDTEDVFTMDL